MDDFVLRLLHQHVQPLAQVRRHHVHQPEADGRLVRLRLEFVGVEEDELHLHDRENHPHGGGDGDQRVLAARVALQLEKLAELEARVDHAADAERDRPDAQIKTAETCC